MPLASPKAPHRTAIKSSYDIIVQRNLFSQNRTGEPGGTPIGDLKPVASNRNAKRITLYGVVIKGGEKMALVNSDSVVRDGRQYMWVRVGDPIGRLQVAAIERDRILVSENGSHFEIRLRDRRNPHRQVGGVNPPVPKVIVTDSSG